jgi:signal transduction histidine kinase
VISPRAYVASPPRGYRGRVQHLRSLPRLDVGIAAALAAFGVVESAAAGVAPGWYAWALAMTLPLALRRRFPVAVIAWTLAVILVPGTAGAENTDVVLVLPVMVVLAYTLGHESRRPRTAALGALAVIAVIAAAGVVEAAAAENDLADDLVALLVIVGGAAGAGQLVRARQGEAAALRQLSVELAAEQEARARQAVAEERARMARELHDIIAHSVSLIAVQASAADELLGRDEDRARSSIRAVQETARGALTEMRRLLSVLRVDEGDGLQPQPGLADVDELVAQLQAGGLPVTLSEKGRRRALAPGLDLSAFRVVQEALTNARKHAGDAPTSVLVDYGETELLLEVANAAPARAPISPDGDGLGLAGMRERVRIYGGTLEAQPEEDRFVVRARLPIEAPGA